ncbi:MAG: hypothetical protein KGS72_08640 [Cyanobacteria bacterium REEB67]|nr:hypothetical protein [Cyanobacteria bacterium REEB67]
MDLRLGNLLSHFDLLDETEVERALGVASETGLPVGKVLVILERISNPTLKAVLEAQWMLKDDLLTLDQAKAAMELVKRNGWNFSDALVAIEVDAYATKGARLGELLVAAGQMIEDDVDTFLKVSNQSLLPLGRVLILLERMHEPGLDIVLKMQREIRLGHIDAGEGAIRLRTALEEAIKAGGEADDNEYSFSAMREREEAEKNKNGASKKTDLTNVDSMKLGELLVAAGLISEKEVDIALDIAIANNKMIGEVLTEHSWIEEDILDQALTMQTEARNKRMTYQDVVERLRSQVVTGTYPIHDSKTNLAGPTVFERNLTLYEFLRLTGYMTPAKLSSVITTVSQKPKILAEIASNPEQGLKQAIKQAVQDSGRFSVLLMKTIPEERDVVTAAHNLQKQVNQGTLKLDRSILEFTLLRSSHKLATGA